MKARTKFLRMFNELPAEARKELVYNFVFNPMTLNVVAMEVKMNTKLGKEILKELGYKDEKLDGKRIMFLKELDKFVEYSKKVHKVK